jgi:hypothetical protein
MIDRADKPESRADSQERARRSEPARRRWTTPVVILGKAERTLANNQGPSDGNGSSILS